MLGISTGVFLSGLKKEQSHFLPTCTLNKFEIIVTFETLEDTMMTFELFIPG